MFIIFFYRDAIKIQCSSWKYLSVMHGVVSLSQDKYTAEGKPEDLFSGKPFMIRSFMLMECLDATTRWIQTFAAASG